MEWWGCCDGLSAFSAPGCLFPLTAAIFSPQRRRDCKPRAAFVSWCYFNFLISFGASALASDRYTGRKKGADSLSQNTLEKQMQARRPSLPAFGQKDHKGSIVSKKPKGFRFNISNMACSAPDVTLRNVPGMFVETKASLVGCSERTRGFAAAWGLTRDFDINFHGQYRLHQLQMQPVKP